MNDEKRYIDKGKLVKQIGIERIICSELYSDLCDNDMFKNGYFAALRRVQTLIEEDSFNLLLTGVDAFTKDLAVKIANEMKETTV